MEHKTVSEDLAHYQQHMCDLAAKLSREPAHSLDHVASTGRDTSFLLVSSLFLEDGPGRHTADDYFESTARLFKHAVVPLVLFATEAVGKRLVETMGGFKQVYSRKIYIVDHFALPFLELFDGREGLKGDLHPDDLKRCSVTVFARSAMR